MVAAAAEVPATSADGSGASAEPAPASASPPTSASEAPAASSEVKKKETVLSGLDEIAKYHFPALFVLIPKEKKTQSKVERVKA